MSAARVLRDRTLLTRLLILRELLERPDAPLREVAAALDVTPQAVSGHVAALARAGLVDASDGARAVTPRGVQRLQEGFRDVKRAVDSVLAPLAVVAATSAVARTPVRAGERVGLFMEEGVLVARAGDASSSTGRAVAGAMPGDEVLVKDLQGVVDLEPGALWVVRVPGPEEGGTAGLDVRRLGGFLRERGVAPRCVAAEGTGARVVVEKLGWTLDLPFAPVRAAFHAAQLGVDAALFVSQDVWAEASQVVEALNRDALQRVPVEVIEAPRRVRGRPGPRRAR